LIGGYCATGKSTFSHRLASRLSIPCFNKDTIKEVIGDGFGIENKDVHQKNSAVTFMLLLYIAERFLQASKPCIIESNFRLSESKKIELLLEKYDCKCLTFLFTGDLNSLYKRYAEREVANRHWVHLTVGEDKELFIKSHKQCGQGEVNVGETIKVDATDFEKIDYERLFLLADNFTRTE